MTTQKVEARFEYLPLLDKFQLLIQTNIQTVTLGFTKQNYCNLIRQAIEEYEIYQGEPFEYPSFYEQEGEDDRSGA